MLAETIDFEAELNPEQLEAVTHPAGPQLVLAGAGSGKTRVITYRIAWLVAQGVDPAHIGAVTFTNKAAAEMKERAEGLVGVYPLPAFVGTFHRFALRLLRRWGRHVGLASGFGIVDSDDQLKLVKQAMKLEDVDDKSFRPQAVLAAIGGAKNKLVDPKSYALDAGDFFQEKVARTYKRYQQLLRKASSVDFDDMISLSVLLLRHNPSLRSRLRDQLRYLMVDEYQDTNVAQLQLVKELVPDDGELTAVGDEDQGIYRWRGAELDNILRFEDSFPDAEIRKLERNYRSTQNILDASGAVVANNSQRRGKRLWTEAGEGESVLLYRSQDERDEARWVVNSLRRLEAEHRLSEMAVLVRTNAQTRALEDELLRQQMSYNLVGGVRFYERAEIKDVVAYLRLLRNPHDDLSLGRILNKPTRGIGKSSQNALAERARERDVSLWQSLLDDDLGKVPKRGAQALGRFRDLLSGLIGEASELPLPAMLRRVLEATGYGELYDRQNEDDRSRLENIEELLSAAQEFNDGWVGTPADYDGDDGEPSDRVAEQVADQLGTFLDHVTLVSDTDALGRGRGVSVMTLHSAKGLEFDAVVLAGLEEGILPHRNSLALENDIEEERRLMYVGMTRARKRLLLTTCARRQVAGRYQDQEESRFVDEIPPRCLDEERSPQLFSRPAPRRDTTGDNVLSFFGQSSSGGSAVTRDPEPSWARPKPPSASSRPSPRRSSAETSYYEPDPEHAAATVGSRLRRGAKVRHPKLGVGKVLKIEGSGDETRLSIYFDGIGRRTLVAKYAPLEML